MRRENWLSMSYQKCFMFSLKLSILYVLNKSGGGKKVWDDIRVKSSFFRAKNNSTKVAVHNATPVFDVKFVATLKKRLQINLLS